MFFQVQWKHNFYSGARTEQMEFLTLVQCILSEAGISFVEAISGFRA
jgi:hypothetical protein